MQLRFATKITGNVVELDSSFSSFLTERFVLRASIHGNNITVSFNILERGFCSIIDNVLLKIKDF